MAYEVTASRKRPQGFEELVGQEFVVATLRNSLSQKRIAHAYLFSGPRGVGKTSAARILAKALNCEQGVCETPCGACASCVEITRGNSLDVIEIDGASNTSVNDVREIKDEVLFTPNTSRYKVYIIDEVHMLSNSAFNALLKTIEEPPPYIVFMFATTEIHKVPATIRSRCQQFNFKLIGVDDTKAKLTEVLAESGTTAEEEALLWIAKESTGSLRDAYTLLDQVQSFSEEAITLEKIREKLGIVGIDEISALVGHMLRGQVQELLEYTNDVLQKGVSVEQFVLDLCEYFRSLLFLKHGIRRDSLLGFPADAYPVDIVEAFSVDHLEKAVELLLNLYRNLRITLNSRFELELLMSRLGKIRDMIMPQEVIHRIGELRKGLEGAGGVQLREEQHSTSPAPTEPPQENLLERIVDALGREKLALASSLQKAVSCSVDQNELTLNYDVKDRFSGELVLKEKDAVVERATTILSQPVRVKINFVKPNEAQATSQKIEVVKKVFRGEVVQGE